MSDNYECYVLPNTGHHYFFIPFERSFIDAHGGQRGSLAKMCKKNDTPWGAVARQGGGAYSWIRFRFGTKGAPNNFGVWLAVETNLGDVRRGTLFDYQDDVVADNVPAKKDEYAISPYAYCTINDIKSNNKDGDSYRIQLGINIDGKDITLPKNIDIIWQHPVPACIDVDLVVDFGNTRTVVLALEDNPSMVNDGNLSAVCKNIRFLPRGVEFPSLRASSEEKKFETMGETIADSWFILQEPMFSDWDYPSQSGEPSPFTTSKEYEEHVTTTVVKGGMFGKDKVIQSVRYSCTERVPQMFVEISPAMMGQDAKNQMHNIDLNQGMNISMSSPKRYLWDREQFGRTHGQQAWNMNLNPWSGEKNRAELPSLHGQICRYMYDDGRDWHISKPPFEDDVLTNRPHCRPRNNSATYPRSSAMVWSALTILESAYRQITSYNWRDGNSPYMTRRMRSVHVTFPSGWIRQERLYYQEAWKQAVDIFTLAHMDSREPVSRGATEPQMECEVQGRPSLYVDLDEAVSSQLPFIYSEIKRLSANLWIELYGRNPQPGNHHTARVRVMTVDIGGGTLDSTIVEYRNEIQGDGIALRYKVLFRDCSSFAGDSVTKAIIERVLLPSILAARGVDIEDDEDGIVSAFVDAVRNKQLDTLSDRSKWQRIVTLLFLPIVRKWLTDVATCNGGIYEGDEGRFRSIEECGADEVAIDDFNKYLADAGVGMDSFVNMTDRLEYDPDDINACIEEELRLGIEPLGKFISAYDVDIVTLSGKISEMPKVEELLHSKLPIRKQRIVRMKNFLAGVWYPMAENQRINDAKTVTSVGAALYAAGKNHLLGNRWNIEEDMSDYIYDAGAKRNNRNYWGCMRPVADATGFDNILLRPEQDSNESESFTTGDGQTYQGSAVMINTYIGRQKYRTEDTIPERQYKLVWEGDAHDAPRSPLAVIIGRNPDKGRPQSADGQGSSMSSYEMAEDDIELLSVQATGQRDMAKFDASKVKLKLRTLSDQGFWMEECRFDMEY